MLHWTLQNDYRFHDRIVKWDVQGQGQTLVLVHGTPWSSFNLRHLIKGLSHHFKVYYFDLIGYGQSDKSDGDVSLGIQNEILTELIHFWQLQNPIMIGHDFGGTTALRAHLINQVDYEKLIIIDPVAISPWGSPFFRHVNQYEEAFAGMPDYIHEAVVETYIKTAAHQPLHPNVIKGIVAPWTGALGKAAFYRQIAQADSTFTDEIQPKYSSISIPTLILWGENDTWIPLEKGKQLHAMIPNSELRVVHNSGHLVIEENPNVLIEEIKTFIAS